MKKINCGAAQIFPFLGVAILLAALTLAFQANPAEAAKKKKAEEARPAYAASGPIPGTQLAYENLAVNKHGFVSLTIHNPSSTGVSFSANFTFYDSKGGAVAAFSLSGFATARTRNGHIVQMKNYNDKNFKKATSLKVLGRSGRSVE